MKKLGNCCIFAGAQIGDYSRVFANESDYVICADGGYSHARKLEIKPDVVIGDFDTFMGKVEDNCEVITYPTEKDDTDTMLAIKLALSKGYDNIKLYGALGGRLDHTFANIQSLLYIADNKATGTVIGDNEIVTVIGAGKSEFPRFDGYYFSIFSLTKQTKIRSTKGLKYNVTNGMLVNNFPLGVSNEIIEDSCEIDVKKGQLLVIFSQK